MKEINPRIVVPQDDGDVIEWFKGHFDSVYAVLHPFERVLPEHHNLFMKSDTGPTRTQLKELASPVSWSEVLKITNLPTIQRLNRVLSEGIGAIHRKHLEEVAAFRAQLKSNNILEPGEGGFPDILLDDFLHSFMDWGYEAVVVGNEWGDRATKYRISDLLSRDYPTVDEVNETLYSEDFRLLYGGHWDSFYTFLCGPHEMVSKIVEKYSFEGFFFEPGMHVYWMDEDCE
ncbi:DUF2711 family protein [Leptolyngbya sp. FACHB-36]|uniref:DUF2711 family protein n=1 Tax=Leptolyngbya sp. FACHB-36 TaxID=2692808 RepID=UPI001681BA62|nr:DUF2711 family protein [Leptolyngbya sp. FACHB-36]MBD2018869.1 DUF2711 family protein [Leptolyngbya sp. FACHB-36]